MGRTKKPCPGCGEVSPFRAADEVCGKCARILDNYDRWWSSLRRIREAKRNPVRLPQDNGWLSIHNYHFKDRGDYRVDFESKARRVMAALVTILHATAEKLPGREGLGDALEYPFPHRKDDCQQVQGYSTEVAYVPEEVLESVRTIDKTLHELLQDVHKRATEEAAVKFSRKLTAASLTLNELYGIMEAATTDELPTDDSFYERVRDFLKGPA